MEHEYQFAEPQDFSELVQIMKNMNIEEWVENDDTGHMRVVEVGNMCGGRYELYEDKEFLGCTHDVVAAAQFVAEGWDKYEVSK